MQIFEHLREINGLRRSTRELHIVYAASRDCTGGGRSIGHGHSELASCSSGKAQLMRSKKDRLSVVYCFWSKNLRLAVVLKPVQDFLRVASVPRFRLNRYDIVSIESNASRWSHLPTTTKGMSSDLVYERKLTYRHTCKIALLVNV